MQREPAPAVLDEARERVGLRFARAQVAGVGDEEVGLRPRVGPAPVAEHAGAHALVGGQVLQELEARVVEVVEAAAADERRAQGLAPRGSHASSSTSIVANRRRAPLVRLRIAR